MSNPSAFNSLALGATYDKTRFSDSVSVFTSKAAKKSAKTSDSATAAGKKKKTADAAAAAASSSTAAAIAAPDAAGTSGVSALSSLPNRPTLSSHFDIFAKKDAHHNADDDEKVEHVNNEPTRDHTAVKQMTAKRAQRLLAKSGARITGADAPQPITHFNELVRPPLNVPEYLVDNLFTREHKHPTAIQLSAIPALLKGRDVVACAPTGSGKTVAFLLPLFARLDMPSKTAGVRAIVISPTKELAVQIERETFFMAKGRRWRLVAHGQSTKDKDIFISTPQRAVQLHSDGLICYKNVEYIVFDEGDKLWDKTTDNRAHTQQLLAACTHEKKQVSLFSATLSEKVESMAKAVMTNPLRVIVQGRTAAAKNVKQSLVFCGTELGKIIEIRNMVREGVKPPVLIFVQSVDRSIELFEEIRAAGLHVAFMNAKMSSAQRDETVMNFRLGKIWVLISTELLARGIDFKHIGTVINFDMPLTAESYIHRIGRTGRAGEDGRAVTFFTEDDKERLPVIAKLVQEAGGAVPEYMTKLKAPTKKRLRELEQSTPYRMVVSSKKREALGEKRIERFMKRSEKEALKDEEKRRIKEEEYEYDSNEE